MQVNGPEKYELNFECKTAVYCDPLLKAKIQEKKKNLHMFKRGGTDNSSQTRDIKTGDFTSLNRNRE